MDAPAPVALESSLSGRTVAFTGRLGSMARDDADRLVRSLGGIPAPTVTARTDLLVVGSRGWPLREDGRVRTRLDQARRGRARGWRVRIIPESEFLRLIGHTPADAADAARPFTLAQAAEASGAPPEEVRRWGLAGLLPARGDLYDFRDIVSLRAIADLRARGVPLRTIQESLHTLRDVMPGIERPLAQLRLLEADGQLLAQIGEALVLPTGQQVMDFEGVARSAGPADPAPVSGRGAAEDAIDLGLELEATGRAAEAVVAYRRAIALAPASAGAHFNLGNALRAVGRPDAAEELFRLAIALDARHELAWYNLGVLLEASGRADEAIGALDRALAIAPAFADARFNLAAALSDAGRVAEAAPHWRAYLAIDADSEWAGIARARLRDADQ